MGSLMAQLMSCDLFSNLSEEMVASQILPLGYIQEYQKGQFVITQQKVVDRLGVVLSGRVHILHIFADGSESLMTALGPGEITGVDLVCTKTQIAPYFAMAASNVQLFYIPIRNLMEPGSLSESLRLELIRRMLTAISHDNMKKEYRIAILSQRGIRERILTYLTMQANRRQTNTFSISFSREEMASFLCVNRSALSHELSLMEKDGLIRYHKNQFTLLD